MGKESQAGFTAEEIAELEPGDDIVEETLEQPEPEIEEQEVPETQPAPAAKPAQAGGKPPQGHVPQQALHEAREQLKAERARADRLEQTFQRFIERQTPQPQPGTKEDPLPDFQTDPMGNLAARLERAERRNAEFEQRGQQQQQQEQQQGQTQELLNRYAASVRTFKREAQDYDTAYQFVADARDRELEMLGWDDPAERANRLQYEEGVIVGRALRTGKDPARVLYEYAKARGYKGPAPQQEDDKLARLQRGANAAKTLNGGKPPQSEEMTLERLAELQDSDPDAADKLWEKMRRAGKLG